MGESPIEKVLAKLQGVRRTGDSGRQWEASCPAHGDAKQSLAVGLGRDGRVLLNCYAGCSFADVAAALQMEPSEFYADGKNSDGKPVSVTVALLAFTKRLPEKFLREDCGLTDGMDRGRCKAMIPYKDAEGQLTHTKDRTNLVAKNGSYWPKNVALETYGAWRLAAEREAKKPLLLVEGESDCWTLWLHGFAALGVPGSGTAKSLTADAIAGFDKIYVWQETDDGGAKFVWGVHNRLKELEWPGEAFIVSVPAVKDPNLLQQRDPDVFEAAMKAAMDAARPISEAKDPGPSGDEKKSAGKGKGKGRPVRVPPCVAAAAVAEPNQAPPAAAGYFGATDWGNAQRLVHRHGKDLHYCHPWKKWLVWDGSRWSEDADGEISRRMIDTVLSIYAEAQAAEDADLRRALAEHAVKSEGAMKIRAALELARSANTVPAPPSVFDSDPWHFNVGNGTVDLRTGELLAHRREHLLTKISNVRYDKDAVCPVWLAFLQKSMDGSEELIRFLQLAVGYSLTADVREKCFFFLYGSGDNGKSTFIETISDLMGDYWCKATADTVLAKKYGSSVPNDVAALAGRRLVSTAELPENRNLDEARVKDLTGRDTISARFLHAEWFSFRPVFKLWMYGNHKPTIHGADDGIWKRVRLVPFSVSVPKTEQDEQLAEKLRLELPGILNWSIEGCLLWQRQGLPAPKAIKEATDDYRSQMDVVSAFLQDCCITSTANEQFKAQPTPLYNAYETWSKSNGEEPITKHLFKSKLESKGYKQDRGNKSRFWLRIALRDEPAAASNGHVSSRFDLKDLD